MPPKPQIRSRIIPRKPTLPNGPAPPRPQRPIQQPPKPATKAAPSKRTQLGPSPKLLEFAKRNAAPPPPPPPEYKPPKKWEQFLGAWLLSLPATISFTVFIWTGTVFLRDNWFCLDTVNGSSMAPSLSPDANETGAQDWVVIQRYALERDVRRGAVVTFWKPHRPDEISIKRVVAMPGDTVYPHRGYAVEKGTGKRLGLFDGLPEVGTEVEDSEEGKIVVPPRHIWVEGDNWRKSYDSNDLGPISMGLLDGIALRVWRDGWFEPIQDKRKEFKSRVVKAEVEDTPALVAL